MGHLSLEKQLNTPINLLAIYYAVYRPPIVKHIFMNIMARIIMPNMNKGTSYLNLKIFIVFSLQDVNNVLSLNI